MLHAFRRLVKTRGIKMRQLRPRKQHPQVMTQRLHADGQQLCLSALQLNPKCRRELAENA